MPDHFAALAQPRRPWLDAAILKDRFHRLSATQHPDVPGSGDSARFVALNAAYAVLRDPAARIRHLLEMEAPDLVAPAAPTAALGDLFMRQAALLQRVGAFQRKRDAAASPLARALLAGEGAALQRDAGEVLALIEAEDATALDALRALDTRWPHAAPADHAELSALQQRLAFVGKWRAQLQEAIFQLGS